MTVGVGSLIGFILFIGVSEELMFRGIGVTAFPTPAGIGGTFFILADIVLAIMAIVTIRKVVPRNRALPSTTGTAAALHLRPSSGRAGEADRPAGSHGFEFTFASSTKTKMAGEISDAPNRPMMVAAPQGYWVRPHEVARISPLAPSPTNNTPR